VEEPANGGLRMVGTAARTGLWGWIGAPTASGASQAGAPGLGPVSLEIEELEMEELNLGELNLGESKSDFEETDLEDLNLVEWNSLQRPQGWAQWRNQPDVRPGWDVLLPRLDSGNK